MKKLNMVEKEILKRVKKIRKFYKYLPFVAINVEWKSCYCIVSFYTEAVSPEGTTRKELIEEIKIFDDGIYHQEYIRDFASLYFNVFMIDFFRNSSILEEYEEYEEYYEEYYEEF